MRFTLKQLDVFLAVAHLENVTKAANNLAMSQSACSSALQDLEHQFDTQLFDRVGKRLKINEQGRRLRIKAEALLAAARDIESDLMAHKQVGNLNVGATLTIGNYLSVPLIHQYMTRFTGSRVSLNVANTSEIVSKIANFEIDLGMIEGESAHPDIRFIPWQKDELMCFCSSKHPLASTGNLTLNTFSQQNWIMREHGSGTRQTFDNAIGEQQSQLQIILELQHTEAIKRAVESNIGIACLSKISLEDAFQRGSLVPLKTPFNFTRQLYLAIHKEKFISTGIQQWLTLCNIKV